MTEPVFARDYEALAAEADDAVRRREDSFPALVAEHRITRQAADDEIRIWRAIAAEWHWVLTREERTVEPATQGERLAMLEKSHARASRLVLNEHANLPDPVRAQAVEGESLETLEWRHGIRIARFIRAHIQRDRIAALLWWQRNTGTRSIRFAMRLNDALRAEIRAEKERKAA